MSSEEAFLKKLRSAFVSEANEQVERISTGLASLRDVTEDSAKKLIIENTFREVHNMKGSARAVNLVNLEAVCQSLEDVLAGLKRSEREVTPKLLDTLHEVVDTVSAALTTIENAPDFEEPAQLTFVLEKLKNIDVEKPLPTEQPLEKKFVPTAVTDWPDLFDFKFPVEPVKIAPPPPPVQNSSKEVVRISTARLDELLMRAEDMLSLKIRARQHNQDLNNVDFKFNTYSRDWTKVYSDVRAARQLINHAEPSAEHLFVGSVLTKVLEFLDWQQSQLSVLSGQLSNLKSLSLTDYRLASATIDSFLEDTKKLLMMPASTVLELMPKLVRDLARELGKEVDLSIQGSTIQLDKRVLAQLKDPLVHILRNSIDHGLEKPEERLQSGKSPRGTLNITVVQQEGNMVEIVVTDDGAGINVERIKEIATANGLITKEDAAKMRDEEVFPLIFQSSFSTSSTISEISGRGLGLAIAKENITKLGGRLLVESKRGFGTTFRIILPVTIATFRGVLIRCSGEILVVPTADMERVLRVKEDEVKSSEGSRSVNVDGRLLPLFRLDEVLELPMPNTNNHQQHQLLIVLHKGDTAIAFAIDEVLEEQEVLVKKLAKPFIRARNLAGLTILGSGKPAPILNVPDVIKSAQKLSKLRCDIRSPRAIVTVKQKRILVVDDTITARILMKNILESAGYFVKTANDGIEALKLLRQGKFDLLVTDIEMPKMNGIELTEAVKKSAEINKTPIILVTSMTDKEYRDRGQEVGADAFFVKSSFDQNNLLDVVKRLI